MDRIVECVPNFSEGRREDVIEATVAEIRKVEGATLLNVDPDRDYNRVVVTFVGDPDAVKEAAFQATRKASELIDMSQHKGEHPRMGAADVVPFVPVSGVTMGDCVRVAHEYGRRVGEKLKIPVYLYEEAATRPERRNLANIRQGEYEGLAEKLKDPDWRPDYGPTEFNPKSGATVTGARVFLIAYNVNLGTNDQAIAHEIALRIRESGRPMKDENGKVVKDEQGKSKRIPGSLKAVKAMGVLLEEHNIAQVSINLVNYEVTPPHVAFEEVKKQAASLGVKATGSEVVGLTPKAALLEAGKHYSKGAALSEDELIALAVQNLGLSQLAEFRPEDKVIEYMI